MRNRQNMILKRLDNNLTRVYVRKGNISKYNISIIKPHEGATTKAINFPPFFLNFTVHRFSNMRIVFILLNTVLKNIPYFQMSVVGFAVVDTVDVKIK